MVTEKETKPYQFCLVYKYNTIDESDKGKSLLKEELVGQRVV